MLDSQLCIRERIFQILNTTLSSTLKLILFINSVSKNKEKIEITCSSNLIVIRPNARLYIKL